MFTRSRNAGNPSLVVVLALSFVGVMATSAYAQSDIQGRAKQILVESLTPASESDAKWQAVVVMENSGTVSYRPSGTLEILDVRGNRIQSIDFPKIAVPGNREQRLVLPVKTTLPAGSYTLRANVGFGNGEVQKILIDIVIDRPSATAARVQEDYPVPIS